MEPDKRPILRALEISATGARLFNDIVCWIFAVQEGRELPHRDGWELAAALDGGERFELLLYGYPDGGRTGMELA